MAGSTGVINGSLILFYVGGVAVGSATSHSLNIGVAVRKTTTKGNAGWETGLGGIRNWTASGNGLVVFADTYGFSQLFALVVARAAVTVRLSTEVSGDKF